MVSLIAAVSENGVIGVDNKLPWYIPDDLKRFKKLTSGNVVIMGRKTYESLGKPLPNRLNIVISRNKDLVIPGCLVFNNLSKAIKKAGSDKEIFIIGGGEIYRKGIILADKIYLTKVHQEVKGDTTFPEIVEWDEYKDMAWGWHELEREEKEGYTNITYKYFR
jgi:dihydrofolate reductase